MEDNLFIGRGFEINHQWISVDNWCDAHMTPESDMIESLHDIIADIPELEPFKGQVRSMLKSWIREHNEPEPEIIEVEDIWR